MNHGPGLTAVQVLQVIKGTVLISVVIESTYATSY